MDGAIHTTKVNNGSPVTQNSSSSDDFFNSSVYLNASYFNNIYGASDTVQPKSITYLPIIRAF